MRAVVIERHGGPEVLAVRELPAPRPGPGQVLVDVEVAGVNYRDVYERTGGGQPPLTAGVEGAGTVAELGDRVTGVDVGDRVAWASAPGSYAEQVVVDAQRAVPVTASVTTELAAAALLQGMTAHYLGTATYPVQAGDTVLVQAAAGSSARPRPTRRRRWRAKPAPMRSSATTAWPSARATSRPERGSRPPTTESGGPRSTPASTPCACGA
jgi:NADPH2:quinone reductase